MASHLLSDRSARRGTYHPIEDGLYDYSSRAPSPNLDIVSEEKDYQTPLPSKDTPDHPLITKGNVNHSTEALRSVYYTEHLPPRRYSIFLRWLWSLVLCILIAGHLKAANDLYSGLRTETQRAYFGMILNVVMILLAINLKNAASQAYNIATRTKSSRHGYAGEKGREPLRDGFGSSIAVHAAWNKSKKGDFVRASTFLGWYVLLLGAPLAASTYGLMYTFKVGNATKTDVGKVLRGAFDHFNTSDGQTLNTDSSTDAAYFSAHLYGDISPTIIESGSLSLIWGAEPVLEYSSDGEQSWTYHFRDSNLDRTSWKSSDRSVKITSKCSHFPIVEGQMGTSDSVTYQNGSSRSVLYNLQKFAPGATVWINARADVSPWSFCGPRCARVLALQYLNPGDDENRKEGSMFDCQITVSDMDGGQSDDSISDGVASVFAGSIGLRGFIAGNEKWQYTRYSRDMFWGEEMGTNASTAEYKAGKFAAGAVAVADVLGPRKQETGNVPLGPDSIVLAIYWIRVFIIIASLLAFHLGISILALWNIKDRISR